MTGGHRGRSRSLFCLALLVVAARATGQGVGDEVFSEREIERDTETYTLVSYEGQAYRRIDPAALRSLTVGVTELGGLPVCVEGKFDRLLTPKVFKLMGSDRQFALADRSLIDGVMSSDNVWVGGIAQRVPSEASCYVAVRAVVRLKGDEDLFRERSARFARERDWKKLLGLGRWIEANGKLVKATIVADVDLYRSLRDRAFRQALRVREHGLGSEDVETRYEIAQMYRDLLGRAGDLKAAEHLRRVIEAAPGHAEAKELLTGLGYVAYKGRWMTQMEREALVARERSTPKEPGEGTHVAVTGDDPKEPSVEAAVPTGRLLRMLEVERRARAGPEALLVLAAGLPNQDEMVARRLVWILANTGGTVGLEGLVKGMRSGSVAVRKDVADALAWCGCVHDLVGMVRSEKKVDVRSHAVSALGSVRTRGSIGGLIDLLSVKDMATRTRVREELARATGQTIAGADAWRQWWEKNRDGFKERGATP